MNQANKIIKYVAIAFAVFLIFTIISGILFSFSFIGNLFKDDEVIDLKEIELNQNIEIIDIDVNSVNITIKQSNLFKIETNNKYINHKQNGTKLSINEKKHNWFKNNNTDLIIYIPTNTLFENFEIENGAGKVIIDNLLTKKLVLDLGAGKVEINNLEVKDNAEIDGGAGEISIKNGIINNLDMDMGVGKLTINAQMLGNSDIDAGVGELNLNDYIITVDKGIGSVKISNEDITNGKIYGNGNNKIDIDGGVGSIKIDFIESNDKVNYFYDFTRTYKILNITSSQEENSYYLTLQEFQGEVDTVLVKNIKEKLQVNENYEFNFSKDFNNKIDDNIDSIFKNSVIKSITKTDKKGLEQIQDGLN